MAPVTRSESAPPMRSAPARHLLPPTQSSLSTASSTSDLSTTSTIVKGLADGTGYTFRVSATNAVGTGPSSAASNAVVSIDRIFDFRSEHDLDDREGTRRWHRLHVQSQRHQCGRHRPVICCLQRSRLYRHDLRLPI